jgi:hypothetical protein
MHQSIVLKKFKLIEKNEQFTYLYTNCSARLACS